eukprot:CAMPEP_0172496916 /NCGR_PEP_ID=MMETSP1066-20121228/94685_1 /TAXON_ID=671091 /ORGANISM="Coscinodiscus wailesii, Strain CCMP2513" /LENGTH=264 /DNA_ID=CAMNT_0013269465 /DNA_START=45 /DNA_END=842 /DNA_ORIENTATION=-
MTTTWDGNAMTQTDMMIKDTVLVLDENDNVIGSASKKKSHDFSIENPRGILHRAFSVFMFDEDSGELLLQKRASSKITFPNVWTNTCCSHPLHGMSPPEIDDPSTILTGQTTGVINGAIRKLEHELGIPPSQLRADKFKFLTRFHYWAADTVTHGPDAPWGEHEIDYVLFYLCDKKELTVVPHPDEVDDVKWVSREALVKEMEVGLWSPWFRILANKWLLNEGGWWEDLAKTMAMDPDESILRFDPPAEHMGGKGKAGAWLGTV